MNKELFYNNFCNAIEVLIPFTQKYLVDDLPENLSYLIFLNQSYDKNELIEDEKLFPEESYSENRIKEFKNKLDVINFLWRDKKIPEWINLCIHSYEENVTYLSLICCGRFTATEDLLYHKHEGYPPFHVLGPSLPVGFKSIEVSGKFNLAWHGRKPKKNEPYW